MSKKPQLCSRKYSWINVIIYNEFSVTSESAEPDDFYIISRWPVLILWPFRFAESVPLKLTLLSLVKGRIHLPPSGEKLEKYYVFH